jgi:hypothetical protein
MRKDPQKKPRSPLELMGLGSGLYALAKLLATLRAEVPDSAFERALLSLYAEVRAVADSPATLHALFLAQVAGAVAVLCQGRRNRFSLALIGYALGLILYYAGLVTAPAPFSLAELPLAALRESANVMLGCILLYIAWLRKPTAKRLQLSLLTGAVVSLSVWVLGPFRLDAAMVTSSVFSCATATTVLFVFASDVSKAQLVFLIAYTCTLALRPLVWNTHDLYSQELYYLGCSFKWMLLLPLAGASEKKLRPRLGPPPERSFDTDNQRSQRADRDSLLGSFGQV